jgi:hypothetical protein
MDKNPLRSVLEYFESIGKKMSEAESIAADKNIPKSVGIEVTIQPTGVKLLCERFRLTLAPDRARALGHKLIAAAEAVEKLRKENDG